MQKKQALEKIPSIDQWILESCSYDKQNKTLSANGRLIRRGRPVFFKERLFYYEGGVIQALMESQNRFSDKDRRVIQFLNFVKKSAGKIK